MRKNHTTWLALLFAYSSNVNAVEELQSSLNLTAIGTFLLSTVATLFITWWAAKKTRSRSDFYVAGSKIGGLLNGFAIAGDTMSAAAFIGIVGLAVLVGFDMLYYIICVVLSWAVVLCLIADRLRNLGTYTFADVVSCRLAPRPMRILSACGSLAVVVPYLVAQIVAAGTLVEILAVIVLLGTGDPAYHRKLERLATRFPDRLAVNLTFDNALAHQIEAGADAFLMPSRFEPCGLNQMYSMRFGTVPIVRRVGGLADTVADMSPATASAGTATGFVFEEYTASAVVQAVKRAVEAFDNHAVWASLMQAGMRQDVSWERSAHAYAKVYERALAQRRRG